MNGASAGLDATPPASESPKFPRRIQADNRQPDDLYIPPDALEVFLDAFEGPLDLLLYLIRKQDIDILDIPVVQVTRQYLAYIEFMQKIKLDLASEYLVMAAWLAEIKSRVLLPTAPVITDEENFDPRAELIRRLQEYEQFKMAAERLDALPRVGRDIHLAHVQPGFPVRKTVAPAPDLPGLLMALHDVLIRSDFREGHIIRSEPLSVRERMTHLMARLQGGTAAFDDLLDPSEGRAGVVVVFLAILELVKMAVLDVVQDGAFGPVTLALRVAETGVQEYGHGG